jgi:hypothetical protein
MTAQPTADAIFRAQHLEAAMKQFDARADEMPEDKVAEIRQLAADKRAGF